VILYTDILNGAKIINRRFANPVKRLPLLIKNDRKTLLYLPVALLLIVPATIVMFAGVMITIIKPNLSLLSLRRHLENTEHV